MSGPDHGFIAVEVTRAFQGPRVGEPLFSKTRWSFGGTSRRIADAVCRQGITANEFAEVRVVLAPGVDAFLEKFAQFHPIRCALDTVFGHCVDPVLTACAASRRSGAPGLSNPMGGDLDLVHYVQCRVRSGRSTSAAGVPVGVDIGRLLVWENGGRTEIWPLYVGIDSEGIVQAVCAKAKRNLEGYRKVATHCGIRDVWLLVVADGSPHTTLMCTPQVTLRRRKRV